DHAKGLIRLPTGIIHESPPNPSCKKRFSARMVFSRGRGAQKKGRIGVQQREIWIMRREHFDGRRFLAQVLVGVNVVIWGAGVAWAQEKPKLPESKPTEYVGDTFEFGCKDIRVWRFDRKQPAVLLLHGADGGVGVEHLYCAEARRLASNGF